MAVGADVLGQDGRSSGGRCQSDHGASGCVPGVGDDLHGGGLAGAGRSDAGSEQGSGPDQVPGQRPLAGIQAPPFACLVFGQDMLEDRCRGGDRDRGTRSIQGKLFGVQDGVGGELFGVGVPVHPGPVRTGQGTRQVEDFWWGQRDDQLIHGGVHHRLVRLFQGLLAGEHVALECGRHRGLNVRAAELCAPGRHRLHCPLGHGAGVGFGVEDVPLDSGLAVPGDPVGEGVQGVLIDDLCGPLAPAGAVLVQRQGRLFGVAGIQDGFLPQGIRGALSGLAAVLCDVVGNELVVDRPGHRPS